MAYLQSLRLGKEGLIQALGLSFTVSTAALAIGLFRTGALASQTAQLAGSVLALAPALAGMFAGQALRQKMSVETFRKVFFAGLLALCILWARPCASAGFAARNRQLRL